MRSLRLGLSVVGGLLLAVSAAAGPVVHTFSIVARDPKTGEMGVAVQLDYQRSGSGGSDKTGERFVADDERARRGEEVERV